MPSYPWLLQCCHISGTGIIFIQCLLGWRKKFRTIYSVYKKVYNFVIWRYNYTFHKVSLKIHWLNVKMGVVDTSWTDEMNIAYPTCLAIHLLLLGYFTIVGYFIPWRGENKTNQLHQKKSHLFGLNLHLPVYMRNLKKILEWKLVQVSLHVLPIANKEYYLSD